MKWYRFECDQPADERWIIIRKTWVLHCTYEVEYTDEFWHQRLGSFADLWAYLEEPPTEV